MHIVLVRQQPSIGDCLLLSPLTREIKRANPEAKLTVITDPSYMGGALLRVFEGNPYVDSVEGIPVSEWVSDAYRPLVAGLTDPDPIIPASIRKANKVFYCDGAFVQYEREHNGQTPLGIAEFWLDYHKFGSAANALPVYVTDPKIDEQVSVDFQGRNNLVGIVLKSGAYYRDWNVGKMGQQLCDYLHTSGFTPVSIDPIQKLHNSYALSVVGKQLPYVASLIKQCKFVITPDTGLLHLAQAVGTKTVALWGIMDPYLRVKGYNTVVVPSKSLGLCSGQEANICSCCRWKFQQWSCMNRITLRMVTDGIERAITAN